MARRRRRRSDFWQEEIAEAIEMKKREIAKWERELRKTTNLNYKEWLKYHISENKKEIEKLRKKAEGW